MKVSTVDSFQGSEKEAIIVSFVRSNSDMDAGFLEFKNEGPRRLNVALTRAKKRCTHRELEDVDHTEERTGSS
ncbi:hypothetical protein D8S78_24485 [Natrialba swarupiae]|nr:hypothetical protein [Natrialba swarupiae]